MEITHDDKVSSFNHREHVPYTMKRDSTIDIAKGFGIIFVIIGHMNHFFGYEEIVPTLIYSFHMPLFIILSGYVFNYHPEISSREYVYKRFLQIIKPYFIFAVITYLYDGILSGKLPDSNGIYGIFIGNGIDNHLNFNIALWFLPMLFLCNIIFYFTIRFSQFIPQKRISWFALVISSILLTIVGYIILQKIRLPWGMETALFSQFFMLLGYILKIFIRKYENDSKYKKIFICLFPVIFLLWWFGAKFNGRVDMNAGTYGNVFMFFCTAICGSYLILQISYFINKVYAVKVLLSMLGKNSLYIMAFHLPATSIVYNVILPYMPIIIKENAWQPNCFGILFLCIGDIVIALLIKLLFFNSGNSSHR